MFSSLTNKKCLVFGANGYLGRHLVHYLIKAGCLVIAYGLQNQAVIPGVDYRIVNISDMNELTGIDWNVDFVFMFAGITGTYNGFDKYLQFVEVNEIGLLNILTCIRDSVYRPKVVFPSTRLVYRGSDLPLKEDDPKKPKTIYAINKLACENILEVYKNTFCIPYTIYRICVPYGNIIGNDYSYGTVGAFLKQAKTYSLIKLYGDGSLRRTFTHVEDICRQIMFSCSDNKSMNETFNIAGEDISLKEVSTLIANKYNSRIDFIEWPENDLKIESGHTVFNSDKLIKMYNIELNQRIYDWLQSINF